MKKKGLYSHEYGEYGEVHDHFHEHSPITLAHPTGPIFIIAMVIDGK